jgi:hypothetical protein
MLRNTSRRALTVVGIKWLIAAGLAYIALWSAWVAPDWSAYPDAWRNTQLVFLLVLLVGLIEQEGWVWLEKRARVAAPILRLLVVLLMCTLLALVLPRDLDGFAFVMLDGFVFNLLLALVGLLLKDRTWGNLGNLGVSIGSLAITLLLIEVLVAPSAYRALTTNAGRAAQPAEQSSAGESAEQTRLGDSTTSAPTQPPATSAAALPASPAPTGVATAEAPPPSPTPLPIAKTEIVGQAGPGPKWGPLTGWGTNLNTTIHSWMDGVYDVTVQYNGLGFRGPDISYDKPDDVYRIMLIGDSYVEALQVDYKSTIYARLSEMLKNVRTPDGKRIEVFGVGVTGWGTLQEYLYYHNEGYRFHPDLIVDFFVINDVADNNPTQFYNYRDLDFMIDDDRVRAIKTDEQGLAPEQSALHVNPGKRWLDALPAWLQNTAAAGLMRLLVDPPRLVVPLQGELTRVHPQNYIYVAQPEIAGYREGWLRTQQAYEIWDKEARANGSQLIVVQVDISLAKIIELSTYFADQTQGWVWDADLPTKKLAAILQPLGVPLIQTRDAYKAYADSIGKPVFDTLFYPQDWHWNATGHEVTAELLAKTLRDMGIVAK